MSNLSRAQTVPSAAEPQRLDKRFEQPKVPDSVMEPQIPKTKSYKPPADLKKIRFILKKIVVKGSTVYSHNAFRRWQKRYVNKKVSLALIYRLAEKITTKYRNDGYLLSRAIVIPQKIKNAIKLSTPKTILYNVVLFFNGWLTKQTIDHGLLFLRKTPFNLFVSTSRTFLDISSVKISAILVILSSMVRIVRFKLSICNNLFIGEVV